MPGPGRPFRRKRVYVEDLRMVRLRDVLPGLLRNGKKPAPGELVEGRLVGSAGFDFMFAVEFRAAPRNGGCVAEFRCPVCFSRRRALFIGRGQQRIGCRGCLRLVYRSQGIAPMARAEAQVRKLRARLGSNGRMPRGMWLSTYDRLWQRIGEQEGRIIAFVDEMIRSWGLIDE